MKIYLALAAVIVCVLAMGITSMGGPERIVRMMTQNVGDREVDQVDSNHTDKENKVIERRRGGKGISGDKRGFWYRGG